MHMLTWDKSNLDLIDNVWEDFSHSISHGIGDNLVDKVVLFIVFAESFFGIRVTKVLLTTLYIFSSLKNSFISLITPLLVISQVALKNCSP